MTLREQIRKIMTDPGYDFDIMYDDMTDDILSLLRTAVEEVKPKRKDELNQFHEMAIVISDWMKQEGYADLDIKLSAGRWALRVQELVDKRASDYHTALMKKLK